MTATTRRRFYKQAEAAPVAEASGSRGDLYGVRLDGRVLKTPAKKPLHLPSRALAEAVACEWAQQADEIEPRTMPLTSLAYTAIDRVTPQRALVIDEVAKYAETDLVCYRVPHPRALVERQEATWGPLVTWAERRYDISLAVTESLLAVVQPPQTLDALRAAAASHDDLALAALHGATTGAGSLIISLALLEGEIDAETAWAAAQLDETFQIERWGEDEEAAERREALRADLAEIARFHRLLRA